MRKEVIGNATLYCGDCLDILPTLPENSIDTVITDPPYGLKFMGKKWDHGVPGIYFWEVILRVAKPGAFMLAFGGTRTHHRLMVAIEDAGWEIRDCMMWLYGSGFPKSLDISKAIDKAAGAEREVVGSYDSRSKYDGSKRKSAGLYQGGITNDKTYGKKSSTAPATASSKQWDGYGTALKPAWEPIIIAMKPLDGTFVQNALKYGVAGLNIDGGRIETKEVLPVFDNGINNCRNRSSYDTGGSKRTGKFTTQGRFPANLILDESSGAMLDEQSGQLISGARNNTNNKPYSGPTGWKGTNTGDIYAGSSGGASRFFYTSKASRSERGKENDHPAVKPIAIMEYLCKLTTMPTGGNVLDPFMGSGTTGVACANLNRPFIGIQKDEKDAQYFDIACNRIEGMYKQSKKRFF